MNRAGERTCPDRDLGEWEFLYERNFLLRASEWHSFRQIRVDLLVGFGLPPVHKMAWHCEACVHVYHVPEHHVRLGLQVLRPSPTPGGRHGGGRRCSGSGSSVRWKAFWLWELSFEQQRWPWDSAVSNRDGHGMSYNVSPLVSCKHLWPTSFAQLGRPAGYTLHVNLHVNLDVQPRMAVWH